MHQHTVLITGASRGIGYETAVLARERGHTVIATAPSEDLLASLPSQVALKLVVDICDQASIDRALSEIKRQGMRLSCLVNNAGFAQPGPIELVDDARLRRQFDVNVFGTLAMTRAALPLLRQTAIQGGAARIITLSSMLGLISLPFQGIYAASKHALEAAFEALRMELRGSGIDVSLVEPGWITTQFLKTALTLAAPEWLNNESYGKQLSNYFAISREAETQNPSGAAKIAASMTGTAQQVAQVIAKVIEAKHPKARYPVTAMAKWMPRMAAVVPTALWDRAQTKQFSQ